MKIEEIPLTIERMWDFIVPSILEIVTSILILILIAGSAPLYSIAILLTPYINAIKDPALINLLSAYGIIKLTPIILLFVFLIFAYAFHKVAHTIGDLSPIMLAWDHHAMMARKVSSSLVADVWQYYPNINNVPDLKRIIDDRLERAKIEGDLLFATAIFLEKRFNKLHEYLIFLQYLIIQAAFIIASGIICTSLSWKDLFINGFVVILSLLVIYAFLVWQQLKYLGQLVFWQVFTIRTSLQAQMQKPVQPDIQRQLNLQKNCEEYFKEAKKDRILIPYFKWR